MHPCTHSFSEGLGGSTLFWPFDGSQSALSVAYIIQVVANCFSLLMHWMRLAASFARASAGSSNAARMAIMAMTTNNSMRVKPRQPLLKSRIRCSWNVVPIYSMAKAASQAPRLKKPRIQVPSLYGQDSGDFPPCTRSPLAHSLTNGRPQDLRGARETGCRVGDDVAPLAVL